MSTTTNCKWCGKEFVKPWNKSLYCCDDCRKQADKFRAEVRGAKKKPRKPTGESTEISRIARLARDHNLSYGQYVQAVRLGRIAE